MIHKGVRVFRGELAFIARQVLDLHTILLALSPWGGFLLWI